MAPTCRGGSRWSSGACLRPCTTTARSAQPGQVWNDLALTVQGAVFAVLYQMSPAQVMLLFAIKLVAGLRCVWLPCTPMW
jgi:hypothetical protein